MRLNRRHLIQLGLAGGLMLVTAPGWSPGWAHRAQSVLTTLAWTGQTPGAKGRWQVTHQVHFHDAQYALGVVTGDPALSILDTRPRAQLLLHLAGSFTLTVGTHAAPVALEPLGGETDGGYVYFYLESAAMPAADRVTLDNILLMEIFERQINTVNIKAFGRTQTAAFIRTTKAKTVEL